MGIPPEVLTSSRIKLRDGPRLLSGDLMPSTGRVGPPAQLRCYGVGGSLTEIPFEFAGIPMP
jgi:hypothetical protein